MNLPFLVLFLGLFAFYTILGGFLLPVFPANTCVFQKHPEAIGELGASHDLESPQAGVTSSVLCPWVFSSGIHMLDLFTAGCCFVRRSPNTSVGTFYPSCPS